MKLALLCSWGGSLAKRMRNIDVLGVTQPLFVVKVYAGANQAARKDIASHFPRRQGGSCHSKGLAELGFAGNVKAAVVAFYHHFPWAVEGPAAFGIFCAAIGLNCFAAAHHSNCDLLGVVIEQAGATT